MHSYLFQIHFLSLFRNSNRFKYPMKIKIRFIGLCFLDIPFQLSNDLIKFSLFEKFSSFIQ